MMTGAPASSAVADAGAHKGAPATAAAHGGDSNFADLLTGRSATDSTGAAATTVMDAKDTTGVKDVARAIGTRAASRPNDALIAVDDADSGTDETSATPNPKASGKGSGVDDSAAAVVAAANASATGAAPVDPNGADAREEHNPSKDESDAAIQLIAQTGWLLATATPVAVPDVDGVRTNTAPRADAASAPQAAAATGAMSALGAMVSTNASALLSNAATAKSATESHSASEAIGPASAPATALKATTAAITDATAAIVLDATGIGPGASHTGTDGQASSENSGDGPDLAALVGLLRNPVVGASTAIDSSERRLALPVLDSGWSRAVAAQVQMMASANVQNATVRLSPEHLGPLEIHIDVQATQINLNFVAAHPDTRSALEQSVPTLRALLAQGGLTLGQTQVQGETRSGSQSPPPRPRAGASIATVESPVTIAVTQNVGLIDEYA